MKGEEKNAVESKIDKMKRHEAILDIVQTVDIKSHQAIVDELNERGFTTVQGTVSRDLSELKITKANDGFYRITSETLQEMHLNELLTLMKQQSPIYYDNVAYHYLKIGKGNASLYAFHLQTAFPSIILEVTIREDGLLMLVNMDHEEVQTFLDFLKHP